jgi:hypothetical protein
MVELAQRKAVGHQRLALWVAVGNNMGGVEKLKVPQTAQGSLLLVCLDDPFAEGTLVQSHADG